jgi:Ring finger domain
MSHPALWLAHVPASTSVIQLLQAVDREMLLESHLKMHTRTVVAAAAAVGTDDCIICMDVQQDPSMLVLPCEHLFHATCIRRWWRHHPARTCPTCRQATPSTT